MGSLSEANRRIRYVVRDADQPRGQRDIQAIARREIDSFARCGADVLVAPLRVIARGHNIVLPNGRSAIASIFVLVRPVPPLDNVGRMLAHVSYEANRSCVSSTGQIADLINAERRHAERRLYEIRRGIGPFGSMPSDLRHAVLCDVLAHLEQLVGRCRRGGTDVRVYLVDGAFHDEHVGWHRLIREAFEKWRSDGDLPQMMRAHGAFLNGLASFADWRANRWHSAS